MNIYDISEKAGVSIATVSRVLNNSPHVSEATRKKVLRVIQKSNYVPNAFARGLGLGSMKTIGLLCPDASDPYLSTALSLLEQSFRAHQYDCLLVCTGEGAEERSAGVRQLINRHVDGIVLMGSSFMESSEHAAALFRQSSGEVPVVLLGGDYTAPDVWCVHCDDQQITCEAVQELVAAGRRRILYLYHSRNYSGRKKLTGYRAGLESCGMEVDEALIRFVGHDKHDVLQLRDHLLDLYHAGLRFDAVMTSEDLLGIGALKFARAAGLRVPEDLAVLGYNNSNVCLCCEPELSSIDNRLDDLCAAIVSTLLRVLSGDTETARQQVLSGRVVCRGSTPEAMRHLL